MNRNKAQLTIYWKQRVKEERERKKKELFGFNNKHSRKQKEKNTEEGF